jgi:hypothetical protein
MSEVSTKAVATSKTLWFNALTLVSLFLVTVADNQLIVENPVYVGVVAVAIAAVNLGLRFVTKTALK